MGFFNQLFGKDKEQPANHGNDTVSQPVQAPCTSEQELLERFGGIALDKQAALGDVIGDRDWNADITRAEISFGDDLVFPIQVLGTFSHSSETWLWAWANEQSGLPDSILQHALQLKAYGASNGIDLLRNSDFDAVSTDLHLIGMTASGMLNASGYYIADYGQGAMVVTLQSDAVDRVPADEHLRILTVFPQLISQFEVHHRAALMHYVRAKGYAVTEDGSVLSATKNDRTMTATFDAQGRLTNLKG